jgi:hypothetical protein
LTRLEKDADISDVATIGHTITTLKDVLNLVQQKKLEQERIKVMLNGKHVCVYVYVSM